jgi:cell division transport system permease protein
MPIKVDYVVRETTSNLGRNISITLASVLTVFVSLALVGGSLMLRTGIENATARWQGGIEFVVYLNTTATPEQIDSVGRDLQESPEVANVKYFDQQASYEEFKRLFADSPEMVDSVRPEDLPPSYRVEPVNKDADSVESLANTFRDRAGVKDVILASKTIRLIQDLSSTLTVGIFVVAGFLLFAAGLLILNTIRMAMFARRREIEVMKLVGATNWFIRVPFMVEGLVQGLLGAVAAIALLAVIQPFFSGWLPNPEEIPLVSGFTISGASVFGIYALLGVVGALVGTIGAGVAVTRFLDV